VSTPLSYTTLDDGTVKPELRLASYPWYLEDWLFSETRASFTLEERGLYRDLLDWCWYHGSLPAKRQTLRSLVAGYGEEEAKSDKKATRKRHESDKKTQKSDKRREQRVWQKVLQKFILKEDGRYHHPKVDRKRIYLNGYIDRRRAAGRKGGLTRAANARAKEASFDTSSQASAKASLKPSPTPSPMLELKAAAISTRARSLQAPPNAAAAAKKKDPRKPPAQAVMVDWSAYDPDLIQDWRLMLDYWGRSCKLPPVDDGMLHQLLDLTKGAAAPAIHEMLKQLFRRGRLDDVRSWGLFPLLLARSRSTVASG
jgi:hypothetical protein